MERIKDYKQGAIRKRRKGNTYSCHISYKELLMEGPNGEIWVTKDIHVHANSIVECQERINEVVSKIKQDE